MKKILGLDLGTNSIGWALVDKEERQILGMGSRIIPMGAELSKFEQGQAQTKNANRRRDRGMRKQNKRYKQRRNKLIYILQKLNMLPDQVKLADEFNDPLKIDKVSILPIEKKQSQYSAFDLINLRVKALNEKISLKDFGRIIYLFNQLRGYSGGGIEPDEKDSDSDEDNDSKKRRENYIVFAKIIELSEPEIVSFKNKQVAKRKVTIETEDGILQGETFIEILRVNESLEIQVNISKSKKGESIFFKLPNKTSWRKKMENLEQELVNISKEKGREIYLSEYFLEILKENRWVKIRNNVILRSRYQAEFDAIWSEQSKHYTFLINSDHDRLSEILNFIFPGTKDSQLKYKKEGLEKGLYHVIRNQVIYYQRELKDQSHLISDCRYEKGEKAIAKSHPVFQEFKIWEQINKLTINTKIENGRNKKGEIKYTYKDQVIPSKLKEWLYDELQNKKEIGFGTILSKLKREYKLRENIDFLNGINANAKLRGNETKLLLKSSLGIDLWQQLNLDKIENQIELWTILYDLKGNEYDLYSERTSAVLLYLKKHAPNIPNIEQTAIQISKIKFARSYAALSLKAIEKILPLVRCGKYFNHKLSDSLNEKIIRILNETVDSPFEKAAQEYLEQNVELLIDGGIMNVYATILVYDNHTSREFNETELVMNYSDIKRLKQGELRNPLVEQVINETLMIIKDIWKQYGYKPSEIRVELARELKNNAERRAKIYKSNRENQNANDEVKKMLIEIKQDTTLANIEKYKLWRSQENLTEEYLKRYRDPSRSETEKMKLWKEQGHISPYTGQPIPLAELFDRERYDVDHIIPQSRYFDDSFANKVICEKSVNKEKGNKTAMEYFEAGSLIPSVLTKNQYIEHVNNQYVGLKRKNLLSTKVPEDPIARQIKETQYISIRVKEELNKIVGNDNVKTTTGGVTDYLRNQWGLTDKFKKLLKDRYEKIVPIIAELEYEKYVADVTKKDKGVIKNENEFSLAEIAKDQFIQNFKEGFIQKKNNKLIIKGWSKRIDNRHHAIDALVIACTEPAYIKRLNDLNKELQTWLDKNRKDLLPDFEGSPSELLDEVLSLDEQKRELIFKQIEKFRSIEMPWIGFDEDAESEIKKVIVSQKSKDKLLIQPANDKDRKLQLKIRGQLHESTLYGKSQGIEAYRIPLNKLAGKNFATDKVIDKICNKYLKKVISEHLKELQSKEDAFSAEGIMILNKKLEEKTDANGRSAPHKPISSIKIFYRDPAKQKKIKGSDEIEDALQKLDRVKSYNESLFVKTGDNYLFAILDKQGKRCFDLISFFDATNLLKDEFNDSENKHKFNKDIVFKKYFETQNAAKLLFTLKQGDAVYMPGDSEEVILDPASPLFEDYWDNRTLRGNNIHYVTKYSGKQIYFIKHNIANPIVNGKEFGSQNAYEKIGTRSIKDFCIKLSIDRLGNIRPA